MEEDGPTEKEEEWEWYSVCCWVCGCGRCLERDNSTITLRSSHAWNSKDDLRIFGTRHVTVSMVLSVCFNFLPRVHVAHSRDDCHLSCIHFFYLIFLIKLVFISLGLGRGRVMMWSLGPWRHHIRCFGASHTQQMGW